MHPLVDDAGKAEPGLGPARPIGDQLVAELGQRIELPLGGGQELICDLGAQPEAPLGQELVDAPGGIVGPGLLEGAVPEPCIGARPGVVVRGHVDDQPIDLVFALVDLAFELVGFGRQPHRRRVGVALFDLGDLGQAGPFEPVVEPVGVRVGREPRHLDVEGGLAFERHMPGELGGLRGFIAYGLIDRRGVASPRRLHGNGKAHGCGPRIPVIVGGDQPGEFEGHASTVDTRIGDRAHQGRGPGDLLINVALGLHVPDARKRRLVGQAGAPLEVDALDVCRPVGVLHRHPVDEHGFEPVGQALHLALADEVDHSDGRPCLQRIVPLDGRARTAAAAEA